VERAARDLLLPDLAATHRLAARLGAVVGRGDVVLLEGDLGAGKSEFARAVIRSVAGEPAVTVPSPTFTLLQHYALARLEVGHADLYRVADPAEVGELGLEECWHRGVLLVEWPDRAPWLWPAGRLEIALAAVRSGGPEVRLAKLSGKGRRWAQLLPTLMGG
jgi:tRNA threonylcarbamoyl adenosine modification protein YjeE